MLENILMTYSRGVPERILLIKIARTADFLGICFKQLEETGNKSFQIEMPSVNSP
jgi:hypothetical protein